MRKRNSGEQRRDAHEAIEGDFSTVDMGYRYGVFYVGIDELLEEEDSRVVRGGAAEYSFYIFAVERDTETAATGSGVGDVGNIRPFGMGVRRGMRRSAISNR